MQKNWRLTIPLAFLALSCCAGPPGAPDDLSNAYQKSIADAAVKRPDYVKQLRPIDKSRPTVLVAHVQPYPTIDTKYDVWVTQPDELLSFCRGKEDPLLAIQQALGLPPQRSNDVRVFRFELRTTDLVRPCASGSAVSTTECSFDVPAQPGEQEHLVLKQIMDSYRSGFSKTGYPFTAMGWSYNWDPQSATHQGVSEYVVKRGAVVSNVTSSTPKDFCAGQ
jgi:hypothetical protein